MHACLWTCMTIINQSFGLGFRFDNMRTKASCNDIFSCSNHTHGNSVDSFSIIWNSKFHLKFIKAEKIGNYLNNILNLDKFSLDQNKHILLIERTLTDRKIIKGFIPLGDQRMIYPQTTTLRSQIAKSIFTWTLVCDNV